MAVPGRPGPRPSLDVHEATRRMQQLLGQDYTLLAFPDALRILAGERSIRSLANKVKLDRSTVYRLLNGKIEPDPFWMRQVAAAFGKHPSYFLEWRMLYITAALMRRLEYSPETSVKLFRELDFQRKKALD